MPCHIDNYVGDGVGSGGVGNGCDAGVCGDDAGVGLAVVKVTEMVVILMVALMVMLVVVVTTLVVAAVIVVCREGKSSRWW